MDLTKAGKLIAKLRKEKGLTQKELAKRLFLSEKTISKWECGFGFPDITIIDKLSAELGVDIRTMLEGEMKGNRINGKNAGKTRIYLCPECGSLTTSTGNGDISCCGRRLEALTAKTADEAHRIKIERDGDEFLITLNHEMSKEHYISFLAYVATDTVFVRRLYPESGSEVRVPAMYGGAFYVCCSEHGLFPIS
jgi:Predicted transcriptional regulators